MPHTSNTFANELTTALATGEITVWFQPQYALAEQKINHVEALARWPHPTSGLLLPHIFMPTLHEHALLEPLLWSTLRQSITAQKYWQNLGYHISVSVNLPTQLLDDPYLPDRLHQFVTILHTDPATICFELTETTTTTTLSNYYRGSTRLRELGFQLSQDDFGTGYNSLHRLVDTPFTEIKIDKYLVRNALRQRAFHLALTHLIQLAKDLGLRVVAEGVEHTDELVLLRSLHCDAAQGFLLSAAVDKEQIVQLLDAHILL